MTRATRSAFLSGLGQGAPFVLVIAPFGILFGIVASEAGWSTMQMMAMSVLVVAGISQFTAVQMIADNVPTVVVILTALAVNLRLAIYSASLALHLGALPFRQRAVLAYMLLDSSYAAAVSRFAVEPEMTGSEKFAYFVGASMPIVPVWYAFTWLGGVAGRAVPEEYALDFALPITFIAMFAPLLRGRPQVAAAVTAMGLSLLLADLPFGSGILAAALGAMAVGAGVERLGEGR